MPIQHIHTYLVHPNKNSAGPVQTNGAAVVLNGKLFELLQGVYLKSDRECDIDITFRPTPAGVQQNDCRDLVCTYLANPTLEGGRAIAERLAMNTDGRSGLGLLFLIGGKEAADHKIVISRFPTDNAIYVEDDPQKMAVEFLERVFMKNKASYKAVTYHGPSIPGGFWSGRAIDKQLNGEQQSNYWILDFLASEFTVTPAAGTRRLALSIRNAAKKGGLDVKHELAAAATLAAGLAGQRLSINEFGDRFGLSQVTKEAIAKELRNPRLGEERFQFDLTEFSSLIAYKSIELSNGGMLTAPFSEFDDVFRQETVVGEPEQVRFITEGAIVNENLRPTA